MDVRDWMVEEEADGLSDGISRERVTCATVEGFGEEFDEFAV